MTNILLLTINKFAATIFNERLKEANIAANNFLALWNNVLSKRRNKLQTFDLCYFVGKNLFGNGGFQNHSYYIVFKRRQRY